MKLKRKKNKNKKKSIKSKQVATRDMMETLIDLLSIAPTGIVTDYTRKLFVQFKKEEHSTQDMFDFLVGIGNMPVTKLNEKYREGDVTSFVKQLCSLDKTYLRP